MRPAPACALACLFAACSSDRGDPEARAEQPIIGGADSAGDAAVVAVRPPDGGLCTGALIAPRVVLTAAHCLAGSVRDQLAGGEVGFGADGLADVRAIESMFVHRRFTGELPGHDDIGLIRLAEPAPATIAPLPWNRQPVDDRLLGATVRAVGFGVTDGVRQTGAGHKRTVDISVSEVTAEHLFAGDPKRNTCQGDSGGPVLFAPDGGAEEIVAVTSYGEVYCAGAGAKTRTDVHADVIAEVAAAWDGPCAADGVCPADSRACPYADPDCDPCGLQGACAPACARVDLDCPLAGLDGDPCAGDLGCESRSCDVEDGVCTLPGGTEGACAVAVAPAGRCGRVPLALILASAFAWAVIRRRRRVAGSKPVVQSGPYVRNGYGRTHRHRDSRPAISRS